MFLVVVLVAGVGYALYRFNTKAGTETVRAFVYLQESAGGAKPSPLVGNRPAEYTTEVILAAMTMVESFSRVVSCL
jgi:hypothetical protein